MDDRAGRQIDESFSNFVNGIRKTKSIKESFDDKALTEELVLFIENDSEISDQIPAVKKNLFLRWKKNSYDSQLAERAWSRIVKEGALQYATKIGKEPRLCESLFSDEILEEAVRICERKYLKDLKTGNVNMEELFDE
jgi:hypothetical protein